MRTRAGVVVALAAVTLLALAACSTPPTAEGGTRPLRPPTHPHVIEYCPPIDAVHFDGDADAVDRIFICTVKDIPPAENGLPRTQQRVDRIADEGVDELLAAYAAPDAPRGTGACVMMVADPLVIWLHEGADVVAVRAPVDECGFPTEEATVAYEQAPRITVLVAREAETDE